MLVRNKFNIGSAQKAQLEISIRYIIAAMMLMRVDSNTRRSYLPFVFDENRIADELTNQFGDRFAGLLKQHGFLWSVWRECLDRDLMLRMLWLSPYRQSYYSELCELGRSLDAERITSGREPFDEAVAFEKAALDESYAEERDREELVAYRLWDLVRGLVAQWTRDACDRAIGEALYDGRC